MDGGRRCRGDRGDRARREPGAGSREPGAGSRAPGAGRREPASAGWHPFGRDFPVGAAAAIAGYAVAAAVRGQFSLRDAALGFLWPAMAASALVYVAGRHDRPLPRWAGPVFAAAGAALYGALPI
ncbi:hypothetical protein [Streptomyces cellulosae]|uniref:hypothetical protein n=1 Tax=Streptomyces cellulosae TaxID=1968 RepID=UPI0004CB9AE0|nr:hypothetical protein [Streptomyces cellulosae]